MTKPMPTRNTKATRPPWPSDYGPGKHAPSIFVQATDPPRRQDADGRQAEPRHDKPCQRRHTGPLVHLDTQRIKRMREEGRNWRSIAMAMGCSMGTVVARMEEDFPGFMRDHRHSPPAGASRVQRTTRSGS